MGTVLGREFAKYSDGSMYSPRFLALREEAESQPLSFTSTSDADAQYNAPLTAAEYTDMRLAAVGMVRLGQTLLHTQCSDISTLRRLNSCWHFLTGFGRPICFLKYGVTPQLFRYRNQERISAFQAVSDPSHSLHACASSWSE